MMSKCRQHRKLQDGGPVNILRIGHEWIFFSIILKCKTFLKKDKSLHGHKTRSVPITEPLGEEEGFHSPCLLSSLQLTEDQA